MNALLSINPEHVKNILEGKKLYEFRKTIFKKKVEKVIIYSTMPVGKVVGEFEIDRIIRSTPDDLWGITGKKSGISLDFFEEYFRGRNEAFAIKIKNPRSYNSPIDLENVIPNGIPPQSFCYIDQWNSSATMREPSASKEVASKESSRDLRG